ncbi:MAG: DUF1361 domain-containing protein, partial [Leptospiraceae bacterium]|nr:DUF1361 domain-containing protein [Leptospiraceae bacterium]
DLIHIDQSSTKVLYEALMIFSIAMQALFFGLYSLKLMKSILSQKIGITKTRILLLLSIVLSSFGIYLGRVLRLSSWDVFTKPIETFTNIIDHLFPISKNPTTYAMIILFSCIQLILLNAVAEVEDKGE